MESSFPRILRVTILSVVALAVWVPSAQPEDDLAACMSSAKATSIRCWDGCSGSGSRLERCTSKCESAFQDDKRNCKTQHSTQSSANRARMSGTQKGGENGCYFGECPEDLKKKIAETHEKVDVDEEPPLPRSDTRRRAALTGVCQTPYGWCYMNQTGPVGYPCWCMSMFGMSDGITIPQQ